MILLVHISNKTVSIQKSCQIVVVAQVLLLLLHLLEYDRLGNVRNQRAHQVQIASAPMNSYHCEDRCGVFVQLLEDTIAVRRGIRDLLLHPFRLLV